MISMPMDHDQTALPAHSSDEDARLARAASRDATIFEQLYRKHYSRVYSYHLLRTGNGEDAQDLTSQTFIAALESISRFRGEGTFAAWLMAIAHNKLAGHFRRLRPLSAVEEVEYLSAVHPTLEDQIERRTLLIKVMQALRSISPDRAEALILRMFSGLSTADTAFVMGKSQAAVKMAAYRALQDLRQFLDVHPEEA